MLFLAYIVSSYFNLIPDLGGEGLKWGAYQSIE